MVDSVGADVMPVLDHLADDVGVAAPLGSRPRRMWHDLPTIPQISEDRRSCHGSGPSSIVRAIGTSSRAPRNRSKQPATYTVQTSTHP